MGEDVLGVERDAVQVSVLLDEVEQFRGVGHPEGQRSRDVLLLLQGINRRHATQGGGWEVETGEGIVRAAVGKTIG